MLTWKSRASAWEIVSWSINVDHGLGSPLAKVWIMALESRSTLPLPMISVKPYRVVNNEGTAQSSDLDIHWGR